MNAMDEVRPSPIAGKWYSDSANQLSRQVDQFLDSASLPAAPGEVIAVVAPHAGHRYSGRTAGHAFATIRGQQRDLVAVIAPMHAHYPADLLTTAHNAYWTPLGLVPVDRSAVNHLDSLLNADGLAIDRLAYDEEHSIEIELPFLQRALTGAFRLLPVMVRSQTPTVARQLGKALAQTLRGQNALLVASTDLSHFFTAFQARRLDQKMLGHIQERNPEGLFAAEQAGHGYACGIAAVAAVLWAAGELGADRVEILHYSTSGDETGDYDSVVGYGAAAALRPA